MAKEIVACLAGKVFQIKINVGDNVEADEEAMVIEAMKMETPIYVPCDGTVRQVNVNEGDAVEEDDVLAVIDEP
jgi:acetyl-CoA carboxylase biotin carboxyl carrier protein